MRITSSSGVASSSEWIAVTQVAFERGLRTSASDCELGLVERTQQYPNYVRTRDWTVVHAAWTD